MSDQITMTITLPTDDEGMIGRECPECKEYFKVKSGTGLLNISTCTCPYCEHTDDSGDNTVQLFYELWTSGENQVSWVKTSQEVPDVEVES